MSTNLDKAKLANDYAERASEILDEILEKHTELHEAKNNPNVGEEVVARLDREVFELREARRELVRTGLALANSAWR